MVPIFLAVGLALAAPDAESDVLDEIQQLRQRGQELFGANKDDQADAVFREALQAVRDQGIGGELRVAVWNDYARVLRRSGGAHEALARFREAFLDLEKYESTASLASLYANAHYAALDAGEVDTAERWLAEAIAIVNQHSPSSAMMGTLLRMRGAAARRTGDPAGAVPDLEQSLRIFEAVEGLDEAQILSTRNSLATSLADAGDLARAREVYEQLCEDWRRVEPDGADYAICLLNLASIEKDNGSFEAAAELARESIAVSERSVGRNHPVTMAAVGSLGRLLAKLGDYDSALLLVEEALAFADLTQSNPQDRLSSLTQVVHVLTVAGRLEEARAPALRRMAIAEQMVADMSALRSDRQRLEVVRVASTALWELLGIMSEDEDNRMTHDAVLRWKNIAGRIAAAEQEQFARRTGPEAAALRADLAEARSAIAAATLRRSEPDPTELSALVRRRDELERKLAADQTRSLPTTTSKEVCENLPPDTALVDFAIAVKAGVGRDYTAFVLRADECDRTRRVDLNLSDVEGSELIGEWRARIGQPTRARRAGETLRAAIWDPVSELVAGVQTVYISPIEQLAAVSWAALPDGDGFLVEKHAFVLLDTPIELVVSKPTAGRGALLVGDVTYDGMASGGCAGEAWTALPGTATEIETLRRWIPRRHRLELRGEAATEAAVADAAPGHRVVHLATHGFFADDACVASLQGDPVLRQLARSPKALTGLVLAATEAADGLWTAEEISGLDLRGVELVVLSACETGLGEVALAEGTLGLHRALRIAGARSSITTLWALPDDEAVHLMKDIYRAWLGRGFPIATAVREAQLESLQRARARGEVGAAAWGSLVVSGAPAPDTSH